MQAYTLNVTVEDEHASPAQATRLAYSPNGDVLTAGYDDGAVRLWDTSNRECAATLRSHTGSVTALAFSRDGATLASGAQDTDIVVWDVTEEAGKYRLRGHTGQVTALAFVDRHEKLLSGSKDGSVRVWDLVTTHCVQFVPNHAGSTLRAMSVRLRVRRDHGGRGGGRWMPFKCAEVGALHDSTSVPHCGKDPARWRAPAAGEVWALAVDPEQGHAVLGGSQPELRMFRIQSDVGDEPDEGADGRDGERHVGLPKQHDLLVPEGDLARESTQRVTFLEFSSDGTRLAAASTGKQLQIWHKRTPQEAAKKVKRRVKRRREKAERRGGADAEPGTAEEHVAAASGAGAIDARAALGAADAWAPEAVLRPDSAVRSFAFVPSASAACQIALALADNSISIVNVRQGGDHDTVRHIGNSGNRSDVRVAVLADDDTLLLSSGNGGTRLWNALTGAWLNSIDTGYGLSALFAPGARYAVLGCRDGTLQVLDVGAAMVVESIAAHKSQVWSMAALPDGSGFMSASADHFVKTWSWTRVEGTADSPPRVGIAERSSINTGQDVLSVRVSPDGKLFAVSLMSNVIKVFYLDSKKWFLDLYGHKLPALSMDISSDSALLASGAADKNLKIWGLDFGDCHKSLFAHQDSVMAVAFVRNTHYVFTAGKDKRVKYWDADKFELLLDLSAHFAEVWCLQVSRLGDFVISGGHDRSLRRWQRSSEPFFIDEEKEKRLERLFEATVATRAASRPEGGAGDPTQAAEGLKESAALKTQVTVDAADALIEALDLAAAEETRASEASAAGHQPNPLLLGLSGSDFVLKAVSSVRANELEAVLMTLPFADVLKLLQYVPRWVAGHQQVELCIRLAVIALKTHAVQLSASPASRPLLLQMRAVMRSRLQSLKNVMGFNMAGLRFLQRSIETSSRVESTPPVVKRKREQLA